MISKKNLPFITLVVVVVLVTGYVFTTSNTSTTPAQGSGLNIEAWQSNGARVMYVYAPELPMVDVQVIFAAGSSRDGDKPGLASMTNLLLNHGAGKWDTSAIAERFESVGTQFSADARRDSAHIGIRSLTEKEWLKTSLDTMATVLQAPRFEQAELDRERSRLLVGLRNQQESPDSIASLAFYKAIYAEHPYATDTNGTKESLVTITPDDLQRFYKQYYVANNALVVIVGAVDKTQAQKIAKQLVGPLAKGKKAADLPEVESIKESKLIRKQHPSSQTSILVGQEGNYRGDPDYFPLYVGNHILGGSGFGSRIVKEIRESRGLAYSSYSYFSPMQRKGPFTMGLQTKNDQADEALKVLMKTLKKFIQQGPTPEELEHSKNNITGGFPLKLDSNKDILGYVGMIGFYNLPLDYLKNFNSNIEQVTIEQIKDAFQRRIHPDKMITVMVGDGPVQDPAQDPVQDPVQDKQKQASPPEVKTPAKQD